MTYSVKTTDRCELFDRRELFKSETATTAREAVTEAVKSGANLGGADLHGADLHGADLHGADLRGADLRGQWIIQGQTRSDGYQFFLQHVKGDTEPMIKVGCRYFTVPEATTHWQKTRGGTLLGDETTIIIDALVKTAQLRGLK